MSIYGIIDGLFPEMSLDMYRQVKRIHVPRISMYGDIKYWESLSMLTNPSTGRKYSYRDIRKVCEAEGREVPALGTLSKYLGKDSMYWQEKSRQEWVDYLHEFGRLAQAMPDWMNATREEWDEFRGWYKTFMGYEA